MHNLSPCNQNGFPSLQTTATTTTTPIESNPHKRPRSDEDDNTEESLMQVSFHVLDNRDKQDPKLTEIYLQLKEKITAIL